MKHVQHATIPPESGPNRVRGKWHPLPVKGIFAGALAVAALLVAGCGSESSAPSDSVSPVAAVTVHPIRATTQAGNGAKSRQHALRRRAQSAHRRAAPRTNLRYLPPKITTGYRVQHPAPGTGANAVNDDNPAAQGSRADSGRPTTAGKANPCALVGSAQAQAITGRPVTMTEAPLGPTCIYHEQGAKMPVTLAVESAHFAALTAHLKHPTKFTVGGRPGVCASYSGSAVTYVGLPGTRVLAVSAPCAVGRRFAAPAVARLGY